MAIDVFSSIAISRIVPTKHKWRWCTRPVGIIALFALIFTFTKSIKLQNEALHTLDHRSEINDLPFNPSKRSINNFRPQQPTFVLHIGPSKTATSTLQSDCRLMQDNGILKRDKTLFIGQSSGIYKRSDPRLKWMSLSGLFGGTCIEPWYNITERPHLLTNSSCSQSYQMLEESYNMNQSIVYSHESWSYARHFGPWGLYNSSVSAYLPYLRMTIFRNWNFHILIGYRDLYDWLVSAMKQEWGVECMDRNSKWPHQNGTRCMQPQMLEWFNLMRQGKKDVSVRWYRYIDQTVDALRAGGLEQNIHLWNFHGDEHITNYLFCNVIEHAMPNACNYSRSRSELPRVNQRESGSQFYNDIVFHAAELELPGLDTTNQSRNEATTKLIEYHQTNLNRGIHDLPMYRCPSERQLQALLSKSLEIREKYISHQINQSMNTSEIGNHFWRLVEETLVFCRVDTQRLFHRSTSWDEVLTRLNHTWGNSEGIWRWLELFFL